MGCLKAREAEDHSFRLETRAEDHNTEQKSKKKHTFNALSWCWGDADAKCKIYINHNNQEYQYLDPNNLKEALLQLRQHKVYKIWVDFILPLMSEIYGNSKCVYVWLGPESKDSAVAMSFIQHRVLDLTEFDALVQDKTMKKNWVTLTELIKRPWFNRPYLLCGDKKIDWTDFADAISLFNEVETSMKSLSEHIKGDKALKHMPDFFGQFSATQLVEITNNLFRRVSEDRREARFNLEHLEPRDTIYALLAIARDTVPNKRIVRQISQGNVSKPYNVDYSLPLSDVYVQFVQWTIKNAEPTRALDIICRPWMPLPHGEWHVKKDSHWRAIFTEVESPRAKGEGIDSLPSWIPTNRKMVRKNADTLVGQSTTAVRFESGITKHGSTGMEVDVVKIRKDASQQGNIPAMWGEMCRDRKGPGGFRDEYFRTLVAERGPTGGNAPRYYARLIQHAYADGIPDETLDTQSQMYWGNCKVVGDVLRRVRSVIWNRRMMRTVGGRLGLIPQNAKKGDLICILYGCSVPVVLRRFEKTEAQMAHEEEQRKVTQEVKEEASRQMRQGAVGHKLLDQIAKRRKGQSNSGTVHPPVAKRKKTKHDEIVLESPASKRIKTIKGSALTLKDVSQTTKLVIGATEVAKNTSNNQGKQSQEAKEKNGPIIEPDILYQLIGECYVDGIMNGEAILGGSKSKVFEIR
ncbi:HET-domain-containing protein [Xylariaceae sp. FL1272]|nr:HET-domain-containing protein [Xylariaceae sp. FL1272]